MAQLPFPQPPSDAQSAGQRSVSYVPADLLVEGEAFDDILPSHGVSVGAASATFTATGSVDKTFASSAFAFYRFSVPGYQGNSALTLNWTTAPANTDEVYVAFANWDTRRWDSFKGSAAGVFTPPDFSHYFIAGGQMVVAVLLLGDNSGELDSLRIGSLPPVPSFTVAPGFGFAPLNVSFDASASSDPDGTIAEYKWDFDGDGVFETSSGSEPTIEHNYTEPTDAQPALRVIDNDGVQNQTSIVVSVPGDIRFSYGDFSENSLRRVLVGSDGQLILIGGYGAIEFSEAWIAKVSPLGTSKTFNKTWSTSNPSFLSDGQLGPDGFIYVCGATYDFTEEDGRGLVQKWSQEGELIWSREISCGSLEPDLLGITVAGSSVYVCGRMRDPQGPDKGLAACLDLDGNHVWHQILSSALNAELSDVQFAFGAFSNSTVQFCGDFENGSADADALFLELDVSGNLAGAKSWGTSSTDDFARCISQVGTSLLLTPYVAGTVSQSGTSLAFVSAVGNRPLILTEGGSLFFDGMDLRGGAGKTLNCLFRRYRSGSVPSSVLVNLSSLLAVNTSMELVSADGDDNFPFCLTSYSGRLLIGGECNGPLPAAPVNVSLDGITSGNDWVSITPAMSTTPQMTVSGTSLQTFDTSGFEFNSSTNPQETFVYLMP